jgi:hypothetical protein
LPQSTHPVLADSESDRGRISPSQNSKDSNTFGLAISHSFWFSVCF